MKKTLEKTFYLKKKSFTMVLFLFAFMMIGVTSMNAQYVSSGQAMNLLQQEIDAIQANPVFIAEQENPQYQYLVLKNEFYVSVYEDLFIGASVADAINTGLQNSEVTADHQQIGVIQDQGDLPPIQQEIVDLLEQ